MPDVVTSCCDGESHEIESFMVESLPPAEGGDFKELAEKMLDNENTNFDSDDIEKIAHALSVRRYLIACKKCGLVLGGFDSVKEHKEQA